MAYSQQRALHFAQSLKGRPRTETELRFIAEYPDRWDYFQAFGIQPETQAYIDETIRKIEAWEPSDHAREIIIRVRLKWSAEALKEKAHAKLQPLVIEDR